MTSPTLVRPAPLLAPLLAWLLCLAAVPAWAHTDAGAAGGFTAGLLHPVLGLDHLLAMVAVGIWGAFLRAPLLWALPVVFPLFMVAGAVLGMAGIPVPAVEVGIALSVLLLGGAILAGWRAPTLLALLLVGAFGALHGHAHGTELPEAAAPAAYAIGFVLSTGLLHLAGVGLGALMRWPAGTAALRALGGAMAAVGAWLLARLLVG